MGRGGKRRIPLARAAKPLKRLKMAKSKGTIRLTYQAT
jgi:hypothetical protein